MDNRSLDTGPGDVRDILFALVRLAPAATGSLLQFRAAALLANSGIAHDRIWKRTGLVVRRNSSECWNLSISGEPDVSSRVRRD